MADKVVVFNSQRSVDDGTTSPSTVIMWRDHSENKFKTNSCIISQGEDEMVTNSTPSLPSTTTPIATIFDPV